MHKASERNRVAAHEMPGASLAAPASLEMKMTHSNLVSRLDAVAARIPQLCIECPDKAERFMAVAGQRDEIEDSVTEAKDAAYVGGRIDSINVAAGLI